MAQPGPCPSLTRDGLLLRVSLHLRPAVLKGNFPVHEETLERSLPEDLRGQLSASMGLCLNVTSWYAFPDHPTYDVSPCYSAAPQSYVFVPVGPRIVFRSICID